MKQRLLIAAVLAAAMLSPRGHSKSPGGVSLAVVREDTNAIVSWPYPSTGFGLEFATKLSTANWQPAAVTTVSNNGQWAVITPVVACGNNL